ncbi:MAG: hypothetical protein WC604_02305 [Candidatus Gracilibacteria bacterium]
MSKEACKNCSKNFSITDDDLKFYKKVDVPPPTLCPQCRQQRRLSFRNEINLYTRKCDFTGKDVISMYSPDKQYKVYDQEVWWSDKWDPHMFGRDFDFNKPFFEQFADLQKYVPRMSLNCIGNENSYFTNYALRNKNSYLVFTADFNEDCYYGRFSDKNFHSCDFDFTFDSTYCYNVADCYGGNDVKFSQKIYNSSDTHFCYNIRNCNSCIFCANIRTKNYCIFNKQVSKEEFAKFKADLKLNTYEGVKKALAQYENFIKTQPRKYLEIVQCENSIGDYIKSCKNAKICFDSYNLEDVAYGTHLYNAKDCYDWDFVANKSECCYEMVSSAHQLFNCRFCMNCWDGNADLTYCDLCLGTSKCFGCVGLRKGKYCILNKRYERSEYDKLMPKIIEHMKKTGEWGEFFPASSSPFAYNESVACEYLPLTKEEALKKGLKWHDEDKKDFKPQTYKIPDAIGDVPESILDEVLSCETCKKNYKVVKQELAFYKQVGLPIQRECFNCRHKRRMASRNPRMLYESKCAKCGAAIQTTYNPRNEIPVYCEKCYLENVD